MNLKESVKFRSETLKQFGFILASPLGVNIMLLLQHKIDIKQLFFSLENIISIIFAVVGFMLIDRALQIIYNEEK